MTGIDWGAVWNALNSSLMALVFAGLVGALSAFTLGSFSDRRKEAHERKRLATLLGYEIAQMKGFTTSCLQTNLPIFETFLAEVEKDSQDFHVLRDPDLSRTIYDKPSTNLSLLPQNLIPGITEIYRGLELCNTIKRQVNDAIAEGETMLRAWKIDPNNNNAKQEFQDKQLESIELTKTYYANINNLSSKCINALAELSKIAIIDESMLSGYKVTPKPDLGATSG